MKSFADGKIDVNLGPTELGAPDDLEQAIVDFIDGARSSLDIAVQEVDSVKIAEAIINARWRGVTTTVFVEQDYIRSKLKKKPDPPEPDLASGETPAEAIYRVQWRSDQETAEEDVRKRRESLAINRVILAAFLRNGVEVKGDFNPKMIFHQKFIVRDYPAAKPTSALLAGSANFTHHDTHDNLNNVFVFHDPKVCREYVGEFRRLERGQFGRGALGEVPETIEAADGGHRRRARRPPRTRSVVRDLHLQRFLGYRRHPARARAWRSQDQGRPRPRAGSSEVGASCLAQARQPRVACAAESRALWLLGAQGAPQDAVIDARTVVAGSFNYTRPANDYNDENIFVLGSAYDEIKEPGRKTIKVNKDRCKALAKYVQNEIERMFNLSKKFTPG